MNNISPPVEECCFGFFVFSVAVWAVSIVTRHTFVMSSLTVMVRSSSASVMSASMSSLSLFLLVYKYLFSLSFLFLWIYLAALIMNCLSVLVGVSV